ncbi:MAG: hypothetical protein LCH83_01090 [Proteobacteria bacterium]|nr:hypothetical protein [Pseudomonadota bacterium]
MGNESTPEENSDEFQIQNIVRDIDKLKSKIRLLDWDSIRNRKIKKKNARNYFLRNIRKELDLLEEAANKEFISDEEYAHEASHPDASKISSERAIIKESQGSNFVEKRFLTNYTVLVAAQKALLLRAIQSTYGLTGEVAKAFSAKVHSEALQLQSGEKLLRNIPLPSSAPELYDNRADKTENAVNFIERVWGEHIQSNSIYRDELHALDPKILQAVRNYCFTRPEIDIDKILPKEPYYRFLETVKTASPDSKEFAEATIKIAERLKKERQKHPTVK